MKIQILGDSFGLPRLEKGTDRIEVQFENTYPELLRKTLGIFYPQKDIVVINSSKRFNNSLFLVRNELIETILIQPDYIVLQVGIVDCWTRKPDKIIFQEFAGKDPWISKDEYFNNLDNFILNSKRNIKKLKGVILVNITKASEEQYIKNFKSYQNTLEYNKKLLLLKEKYKELLFVDLYKEFAKVLASALCSDGLHPSEYGNNLISNAIFKTIYLNEEAKR